tara:strand:+ start:586 stop:1002 length:417 start_codon:yes stop_codon:yes gene_type:complete
MERPPSPTNAHELFLQDKYEDYKKSIEKIYYMLDSIDLYPDIPFVDNKWCVEKIMDIKSHHSVYSFNDLHDYCLKTENGEESYVCLVYMFKYVKTLFNKNGYAVLYNDTCNLLNQMVEKHPFVRVQWGYLYAHHYGIV